MFLLTFRDPLLPRVVIARSKVIICFVSRLALFSAIQKASSVAIPRPTSAPSKPATMKPRRQRQCKGDSKDRKGRHTTIAKGKGRAGKNGQGKGRRYNGTIANEFAKGKDKGSTATKGKEKGSIATMKGKEKGLYRTFTGVKVKDPKCGTFTGARMSTGMGSGDGDLTMSMPLPDGQRGTGRAEGRVECRTCQNRWHWETLASCDGRGQFCHLTFVGSVSAKKRALALRLVADVLTDMSEEEKDGDGDMLPSQDIRRTSRTWSMMESDMESDITSKNEPGRASTD